MVAAIDKEGGMAVARVVSFDGVTQERIDELEQGMSDSEPPEGVPSTEVVVLHDPEAQKSVVILFFDNEDDYKRGDEALNAMPAGDTPGERSGVAKYNVAFRTKS
jgi:hypothetical protein